MSWVLYIVIAINLFAVTNLFDKIFCSKKVKSSYSFALLINILYWPFILITHFILRKTFVNGWPIIFSAFSGITYYFMWIFWWKALSYGELSRAAALFATQPLFSAILATTFLGEELSIIKWIAIILIIVGGFLCSWTKNKSKKVNRAYILVLLSTFFGALGTIIAKFAMKEMPALTVNVVGFYAAFPLFLIFFTKKVVRKEINENSRNIFALSALFIRALIGYLAICFFMLAVGAGPVSLVTAVNASSPMVVFIYVSLLSYFFPKILKEEISKKTLLLKFIAILLIIIGTIVVIT